VFASLGLVVNCFSTAYSINNNSLSLGERANKRSYCNVNGTLVPFHQTLTICCHGKLNTRSNDNRLYCCGQSLYSPALSKCCDGILHAINSTNAKPRCCKSMSYDADRFICCKGHVVRKGRFRNTACCDRKTIDFTTQICCEGRVQPSTEGMLMLVSVNQ
jgi:hypothetical protein